MIITELNALAGLRSECLGLSGTHSSDNCKVSTPVSLQIVRVSYLEGHSNIEESQIAYGRGYWCLLGLVSYFLEYKGTFVARFLFSGKLMFNLAIIAAIRDSQSHLQRSQSVCF